MNSTQIKSNCVWGIAILALLGAGSGCIEQTAFADGPMTRVFRMHHPVQRDWVTLAEHSEPTEAQMSAWGYQHKTYQFKALRHQAPGTIAVYRWFQPQEKDWVTMPEGNPSDSQLSGWGYQKKTFSFYAYPSHQEGTIPVYRWWNANDGDWITIAAGEVSDGQLSEWGYGKKTGPMFYAYPL